MSEDSLQQSMIEKLAKGIAKADGIKEGYEDVTYWTPHAKAAVLIFRQHDTYMGASGRAASGDTSPGLATRKDARLGTPAKPGTRTTGNLKVSGGPGEISVVERVAGCCERNRLGYGCVCKGKTSEIPANISLFIAMKISEIISTDTTGAKKIDELMALIAPFLTTREPVPGENSGGRGDLYRIAAEAITGVRYDKFEFGKNTQCKSEYVGYVWDTWKDEATAAVNALHLYLATQKPMSVNVRDLHEQLGGAFSVYNMADIREIDLLKAVLDAAQVKYE